MYVDKPLSGIKAVQTLSRLNRAHPQKHDVFVLDFKNNAETITRAFHDYYRTTILSRGDRPEQAARPEGRARRLRRCTSPAQVEQFVALFLGGADRDKLDPILDACVAAYKDDARRGRPGRLQGQGQGVRAHLRLPLVDPAVHATPSGRSSRSS